MKKSCFNALLVSVGLMASSVAMGEPRDCTTTDGRYVSSGGTIEIFLNRQERVTGATACKKETIATYDILSCSRGVLQNSGRIEKVEVSVEDTSSPGCQAQASCLFNGSSFRPGWHDAAYDRVTTRTGAPQCKEEVRQRNAKALCQNGEWSNVQIFDGGVVSSSIDRSSPGCADKCEFGGELYGAGAHKIKIKSSTVCQRTGATEYTWAVATQYFEGVCQSGNWTSSRKYEDVALIGTRCG